MFFRVDRRRKMPVTILLKALGYTPERILKEFFAFDTFTIDASGVQFEIVPERLRGEVARFDIKDKVRQGARRQGQAHHGQAHPRHGIGGHQENRRAGRVHPRAHAGA